MHGPEAFICKEPACRYRLVSSKSSFQGDTDKRRRVRSGFTQIVAVFIVNTDFAIYTRPAVDVEPIAFTKPPTDSQEGHPKLHFSDAVNVTLGLPLIRTSVDHGTAYDIAGTGKADPSSLKAAVRMAAAMAENRMRLKGQG